MMTDSSGAITMDGLGGVHWYVNGVVIGCALPVRKYNFSPKQAGPPVSPIVVMGMVGKLKTETETLPTDWHCGVDGLLTVT